MATFPLLTLDSRGPLSAQESAELAAQMAGLAKAGLPLDQGLAALADEMPRRLRWSLWRLADRLSDGEPLETAIQSPDVRLPAHVRGLIVAGLRSGRLPTILDEFAALTCRQHELRHKVLLSVAYPAVLLTILAVLMIFCRVYLVEPFRAIFKDFGAKLPDLTNIFFACSGVVAWGMLVVATVLLILPLASLLMPLGAWVARLVKLIPVIGPILRFSRLAQFSELLAMLVEQQVPLPESLRLTAAGLNDPALAEGCLEAAADVAIGRPLNEALVSARRFPASLTALVDWGQRRAALPEALRAAAETFEARARSQGDLLNMLLPPIAFLLITALAVIGVLALLLPMVSLVW
jgi:type II secretory pathway component PulF